MFTLIQLSRKILCCIFESGYRKQNGGSMERRQLGMMLLGQGRGAICEGELSGVTVGLKERKGLRTSIWAT